MPKATNGSQSETRENAAENPVKQAITPGWIYEGATQEFPYPGAKYYLKRYNFNSTKYDYVSNLNPPFSAESIRHIFGPGDYRIEARVDGQFQPSESVSLSPQGRDGQSYKKNNNDNHGNDNNGRHELIPYNGMSGSERIKHTLADVMEIEMMSKYAGIGKKEVQDTTMNDVLKSFFVRQFERNPIKDLGDSITQLQGLTNLFGKGHHTGDNGKYTLETAIAECIPEFVSILKQKWTKPGIKQVVQENKNIKDAEYSPEEDEMKDIEYVMQKLYAMAKHNQPVDQGVALIMVALPEKDVAKLINPNLTPELLIENIIADYPQFQEFLESEKGKLWITNLLEQLRVVISSRKVNPGPEKKSGSSGNSSSTDGTTQKSSGRQKISSDSPGRGTTKPKPGQSTNG
jgi:hypothetical protein